MICPKCGKDVNYVTFCPFCGTDIAMHEKVKMIQQETKKEEKTQNTTIPTEKKGKKTRKLLITIISVILVIALLVSSFFIIRPLFAENDDKGRSGQNTTEEVGGENSDNAEPPFPINSIAVSERDIQTYDNVSALVTVTFDTENDLSELAIVDDKRETLGIVNDNGQNGDEHSDDGIYSGLISFYSEKAVAKKIYASYENRISDKYETIYFYPEYNSDFYYEYENLDADLNAIYSQYYDIEEAHTAILDELQDKKDNNEIVDFVFEHGSITIYLLSGSVYVYSYNPGGVFKSSATITTEDHEEVGLYTISPNVNTLLSMQPYRDELGAGGVDSAAETVADSSYSFVFNNNCDNSTVNVELMKELDKYNVILLDGHGGYSSNLHSFFGIGTPITESNSNLYWADLYYDRIIQLSGGQYGITAAFFDHYYGSSDFGETIIYLGCCHGADDSVLANTLISKGVDAVFAYRNSVSVTYDTKMVTSVFDELSKEKDTPVTVEQALNNAQSQHGKTDNTNAHWYNWLFGNYEKEENRAQLFFFGDKNFTLSMENSSLRGKVADGITNTDIYNATITATKPGESNSIANTKTDNAGNFNLQLTAGFYDITVQASGYMNCIIKNVEIAYDSTTYLQNTILLEQKTDDLVAFVGGTVTNAVTGDSVKGASIVFRENYNQLDGECVKDENDKTITIISDENGNYYSDQLAYGYYTAEITKDGYVTQYVNVIASDNSQISGYQNIVLAPKAEGNDYRITLEWEENPRDEDAHIVGTVPDNFHVYYSTKSYYDGEELIANLDHDDTDGNGFETITLKVDPEGTYQYYVYHFAGSGSLSTSNAIVKVYQGGVMIKQYNVPIDQGEGRYWNVFNIVDGKVVTINHISDSPSQ